MSISKSDRNRLFAAAESGNFDQLRDFVENGCTWQDAKNEHGFQCIHVVAELNHVDCLQLLLDHGADANAEGNDGETPVLLACEKGNVEIVEILLESGADPNFPGRRSHFTPFGAAITNGCRDVIHLLLKHGLGVNNQNIDGVTPLHLAVSAEQHDVVDALLSAGADPSIQDNRGETALFKACAAFCPALVKSILKHSTDPKKLISLPSYEYDGNTCLHYCAQTGEATLLKLLLYYEPDLSVCNDFYETPLNTAAHYGKIDCVHLILEYSRSSAGYNPTTQRRDPLMSAALGIGDNDNVVTLLIKNGFDPNTTSCRYDFTWLDDYLGQVDETSVVGPYFQGERVTPLTAAILKHSRKCIDILIKHGANLSYSCGEIISPINAAMFSQFNFPDKEPEMLAILKAGAPLDVITEGTYFPGIPDLVVIGLAWRQRGLALSVCLDAGLDPRLNCWCTCLQQDETGQAVPLPVDDSHHEPPQQVADQAEAGVFDGQDFVRDDDHLSDGGSAITALELDAIPSCLFEYLHWHLSNKEQLAMFLRVILKFTPQLPSCCDRLRKYLGEDIYEELVGKHAHPLPLQSWCKLTIRSAISKSCGNLWNCDRNNCLALPEKLNRLVFETDVSFQLGDLLLSQTPMYWIREQPADQDHNGMVFI